MPATKIILAKGKDLSTLKKIKETVMQSVIEALQLPPNDTNIFIEEKESELFQLKKPYEILVVIDMFEGRTKDTKRKLYQLITTSLQTQKLIEANKVLIIINEQPLQNWGIRGGFPADEVDLGFKVNV